MTTPTVAAQIDLDALEKLALNATAGDLDSVNNPPDEYGGKQEGGHYECPCCQTEGYVYGDTYFNFDGMAQGVQFFGIGEEFKKYEEYFRAVSPRVVLELIRMARKGADHVEVPLTMVAPEGWVIVPVEPTDVMLNEAADVTDDDAFCDPIGCEAAKEEMRQVYRTMLAAAPKPAGQAEPVAYGRWAENAPRLMSYDGFPDVHFEPSPAYPVALYAAPQPKQAPSDDSAGVGERYFPYEFEVWQDDVMCASASGPRAEALNQAMDYAMQYGIDGPVRIFEVRRDLVGDYGISREILADIARQEKRG